VEDKDKFPELSDLAETKLRKENLELRTKLQTYEKLLQENGLLERLSQISDSETICHQQIGKLRELSDKGIPFQLEEIKQLEILVKTLLMAQGKAPVVEAPKKKTEKANVATLLQIAEKSK
jgi:hypothetical protein